LTEYEQTFYYASKRHTGGWCGPGQRLTPSAVLPAHHPLDRMRTTPSSCSLLTNARPDQGPDASPTHSCFLPGRVFRGRPHRRNPPVIHSKNRTRPRSPATPCILPSPGSKSPLLSPWIGREKGVGRKSEGRSAAHPQLQAHRPSTYPKSLPSPRRAHMRTVFFHRHTPNRRGPEKPPSISQDWEKEGGWGMD
jgi:hypothetical protein